MKSNRDQLPGRRPVIAGQCSRNPKIGSPSLRFNFERQPVPSYNDRMRTVTKQAIWQKPSCIVAQLTGKNSRPPVIQKPTPFNRIAGYDFRKHRFQKPPIGTSTKLHRINLLENHQQPRKYTGENVVHLRRSHRATETSLYKAYFVPEDGTQLKGRISQPKKHAKKDDLECPNWMYLEPEFRCICQAYDRGAPHHMGGGSIAHCIATCHIASHCGTILNRFIPFNSPGGVIKATGLGVLVELAGWKEDSPSDLLANQIGVCCGGSLFFSCERCCKKLSSHDP